MAKRSGGTRSGGTGGVAPIKRGSDAVKSFLLSYTPQNKGFTSNAEIDLVSKKLNLSGMDESALQEMRNRAVKIYSDAMEKEIKYDSNGEFAGRTEKYWEYSEAMQSVTAIIDYLKVRRGVPVSRL